MKRYILKILLSSMIIILILFTLLFVSFNAYNNINNEKEKLLNTFNIIENIYLEDKNINISSILDKSEINVLLYDANSKYVFNNFTDISNLDNVFKKFLNNQNTNFFIHNHNLYYISYINYDNIIFMSIYFNIYNILFRGLFISILFILFTYFILFFIVNKKIYLNITLPLNEICNEIPKIKDRTEKINFKEYKFYELNEICKEVYFLEKNIANIGHMLKVEENKMEYILDNMTEGFLLFDENKNVFSINKRARKIFNCYEKKLGENILHYTQDIKILESIDKVLETKQGKSFDIKTDDNKTYSVYISKIQKDILKSFYKGGIMLIIDVTIERENEKMKQEFFSNISHELKTPITSIQGYCELLYNDFAKSKKQEKEFLKIIQKESISITRLINDLLTISKLENKEIEVNKLDINIKIVIQEIINSTKPICMENNINIINNCNDFIILADYKKIHQLFNNLIVNAIKYNKKDGYVEINSSEDEKYINISIKDSGIGIPLVDRNRIFERFYRVEKGRSKELGGTGLGLSIVKHIVKYYNGKIKIKSTEGYGSEFIVKLPKKEI